MIMLLACHTISKEQKQLPVRDLSITPANAYNDLFLDTAAVGNFIDSEKLEDGLADRFRSFYNLRNFQFAWFSTEGLTEQARSFWNLMQYKKDSSLTNKTLVKAMKEAWPEDNTPVSATDKTTIETELLLTASFMRFMLANYDQGAVKKKDLEQFIPRKKQDLMVLADSLVSKRNANTSYEEANDAYKQLKDQLVKYVAIAKKGGWPVVTTEKKSVKKGMTDSAVTPIKAVLTATGDLAPGDTTALFNDALDAAVKKYQLRMGFTPDGIVTQPMIKVMNVPVQQRIQQLLINLDRMRWMPDGEKGKLIVANIPEFKLHVYEDNKEVFNMKTVVGKDGHNTVIFTGKLSEVVFAPYWNVPKSIVKKEILPSMAKNKNYLAHENMEIISESGGIPEIRQRPGGKNALGKVKFLFPNPFDIYFHDTPAKSLFSQDQRAFSHGCIRISDPVKMANYLLKDDPKWTPEKIDEAMNATAEKTVDLKHSVPVLITYYTAWVDENGQLNFRDDLYGHDALVAKKMFTHPL
ncbi:MAG: hypothetical protein NVSMB63_01370 [Sediminibacterium sp.]